MFGEVFQKESIENIFNAFGLCDGIYKPILKVNDLGISYRTINNWEANDIMLSERSNNRDWHKFSFVDYVWLNLVQELRHLGFPLSKIKMLKEFLNVIIDEEALYSIERRESRVHSKSIHLSRLVLLLADIIFNKNHIALLCNKEGGFYIYNDQHVKEGRSGVDLSQFQFNNFISISLTDVIIKFLLNVKIEAIEESKILDNELLSLVMAVRNHEVSQLVFYLNDDEKIQIETSLFTQHEEFIVASIRLLLTQKFNDISM